MDHPTQQLSGAITAVPGSLNRQSILANSTTSKNQTRASFSLRLASAVFGLLILSSCGGGGGSDTPPLSDTTAPTVITADPADGATDVPRDTSVRVIFSEDILNTSVDDTSLLLQNADGENISGTVLFDGLNNEASFAPDEDLALLRTYTAVATVGITDLSGNPLATDNSWQFSSRDGVWGTPQLIEIDNAGGAFVPQIAFDREGNALAVWEQYDGTTASIWANRFTPDVGWGAAELIETENLGEAILPQIAVDRDGTALAVWEQLDGTRYSIWANRFMPGAGWGVAELIETEDSGDAGSSQIAFDPDGNALAVWRQSDGTQTNILANRFTPGAGWGIAELIETDNAGNATDPQIAFDPDGNALVVWEQFDGTRRNIWANRFTPGAGWGIAELIETDNAGSATDAQIAVDSDGNALAVWEQDDGTRDNIWANRFVPDTGWGAAELIETDDSGYAERAQVAVDSDGNALAVWQQDDGAQNNIWANRYTPSTGWGAAADLIETDNAGNPQRTQIAVDSEGNALVVWQQDDGTRDNIWANRFVPDIGWGVAEMVETDNSGGAFFPQITVDSDGVALAVWQQSDGTRDNIWVNQFE